MPQIDDSKKTLVLVTGATGAIGARVVEALCKAGCRIRTLSIDSPVKGAFPAGVEVITGDITDVSVVEAAVSGVNAVVHMAALLHITNPSPEMCGEYERVNVGGTANVVDASVKAGVKRIVLFSTIAVYGQSDVKVLDEQSQTRPETDYARTKLAAERLVLSAKGADSGQLGTVLRLGAVYGSRIKGNYEKLTRALARNRFIPVGKGLNRRTLIYDKDVGLAAVLAVSHSAAAGRVFNVTDGEFHHLNAIIGAICGALGRKPPRFSLPVSPIRLSAGFIEMVCAALRLKPPVSRAMIDKYTEDIAVSGGLIKQELGFSPKYGLKAGWEETIQEMRGNGVI